MLIALFISLVIATAIAYSKAPRNGLIAEHSFNNRASDAAGARDDHLG